MMQTKGWKILGVNQIKLRGYKKSVIFFWLTESRSVLKIQGQTQVIFPWHERLQRGRKDALPATDMLQLYCPGNCFELDSYMMGFELSPAWPGIQMIK